MGGLGCPAVEPQLHGQDGADPEDHLGPGQQGEGLPDGQGCDSFLPEDVTEDEIDGIADDDLQVLFQHLATGLSNEL